ncbi:MAG: TrkH family potassium uptake protein [Simkaniaceae bacterium]|nr:TrkH family potassium uptake protein [Simkaniaceae bacterium]
MATRRIHTRSILGSIGLLLHVPAIMFLITFGVALIFHDDFVYTPFVSAGLVTGALAQLLFWFCYRSSDYHLWDAMIIAALSWFICPLVSAIPLWWSLKLFVAQGTPIVEVSIFHTFTNCLFESFSGFTSTGLTLIEYPEFFPNTILWWRSFMQWIGGIGLIVFMLSLVTTTKKTYTLYYAEARSDQLGSPSVQKTARMIWGIYLFYTIIAILIFWLADMPLWESINHAMTSIATGGFMIRNTAYTGASAQILCATMFIMFLGSVSFSMHYEILRTGKLSAFFRDPEHRLLLVSFFVGAGLFELFNLWTPNAMTWLNASFQWFSATATCGFSSVHIGPLDPTLKILLILTMLVGGCAGSTVGGLKISRVVSLFTSMFMRLKTVFSYKEEDDIEKYGANPHKFEEKPPEIDAPHSEQTERLYAATVLFTLWVITIIVGWILLLKFTVNASPVDVLFETVSAMSNVGLSSGITTPQLGTTAKWIFILLMWLGRLEIVPAIILFLAIPFTRNSEE